MNTVQNLFNTYVRMRQQGQSKNFVVTQLQSAVQQIPREDRQRLGELVNQWEAQYGRAPYLSPNPEPAAIRPVAEPPPTDTTLDSLVLTGGSFSNENAPAITPAITPEASRIQSLFATYIRMRREGLTGKEVVARLQDTAQQLPREDRHQFGEMVSEWEDKFGRFLTVTANGNGILAPRPTGRAFATQMLDQDGIDALNNGVTRAAVSPVVCAHCGHVNPVGSLICAHCGQSLRTTTAGTTRHFEDAAPKANPVSPEFFSQNASLLIAIRGNKSVLETYLRDKLVIGRGAAREKSQPFLDLTPFDGEAMGVSRQHCEIRYVDNTLVVSDLGSGNGTFINQVRLHPHEVRVLHTNDILRLGRLEMKLTFRLPVGS